MGNNKKDILKIALVTLIAILLMVGVAATLLAGHKRAIRKENRIAMDAIPQLTPTPGAAAVTQVPSPSVVSMVTQAPQANEAPSEITPVLTQQGKDSEYYFPESNTRYLTDEEVSVYSASELELAKNEIYARHGRKFVTPRIADYFNSKSWYHGTVEPEDFDNHFESIFNEFEIANIDKIVTWENKKKQ